MSFDEVSCGGHHMLVLAAPRPPENQEQVPDKVTDCFPESSYTEILLEDAFIDPTQLVPLSALSARARHREKVRTLLLTLLNNHFNHYILCNIQHQKTR